MPTHNGVTFCISVPVKSHIAYLSGALESLRAQGTICAVALVDASADSTVPVIADSAGLTFAWRRHGPDDGQAAAIDEGWAHAPGEILAWLNDDDLLLPGALDAVAAVFDAEPQTDVVYGHGVMLDARGAFTGYFPSISADPADLRTSNVICQPACFVRRRAVEAAGGLDLSLHYVMDWNLWLRLFDGGARFRFLDRPLAAVRTHRATKTRSGGAARKAEVSRLMASRLSFGEGWRLRLGIARSEARDNNDQLSAGVLDMVFAIARLGRRTGTTPPPIFGLGRDDNRVGESCTVFLPVATGVSEVALRIVTDHPADITARIGEMVFKGIRAERSGSSDEFACLLSSIPVQDGLVRCELSAEPRPWRLVRVVADTTRQAFA